MNRIDALMLAERWCLAVERRELVDEVIEEATSRVDSGAVAEFLKTILERARDENSIFQVRCSFEGPLREHWLGQLVFTVVKHHTGFGVPSDLKFPIKEMFKFFLEQHCLVCADKILNLLERCEAQRLVNEQMGQWVAKCQFTKHIVGEALEVALWLVAKSSDNHRVMIERLRARADHRDAVDHFIRDSKHSRIRELSSVLTSAQR